MCMKFDPIKTNDFKNSKAGKKVTVYKVYNLSQEYEENKNELLIELENLYISLLPVAIDADGILKSNRKEVGLPSDMVSFNEHFRGNIKEGIHCFLNKKEAVSKSLKEYLSVVLKGTAEVNDLIGLSDGSDYGKSHAVFDKIRFVRADVETAIKAVLKSRKDYILDNFKNGEIFSGYFPEIVENELEIKDYERSIEVSKNYISDSKDNIDEIRNKIEALKQEILDEKESIADAKRSISDEKRELIKRKKKVAKVNAKFRKIKFKVEI